MLVEGVKMSTPQDFLKSDRNWYQQWMQYYHSSHQKAGYTVTASVCSWNSNRNWFYQSRLSYQTMSIEWKGNLSLSFSNYCRYKGWKAEKSNRILINDKFCIHSLNPKVWWFYEHQPSAFTAYAYNLTWTLRSEFYQVSCS